MTGAAKGGMRKNVAQKVQVLLVCDLHDEEVEGSETVAFGLDGSSYEIDVCDEHAGQLRDAFAPFVGAARRAGRAPAAAPRRAARSSGRSNSASGDKQRVQEIREWARSNGHKVSERGRLSAAVVEAYEAAH
ncbi:MAG TPA: Lsr2 family protein [Mycobacteriales bacterium]|nr:Lsr2 family protein [Mycobacteriales bacterium]